MSKMVHIDEMADGACLSGSSCAFGVFDGIHKGHKYLFDRMKEDAEANDLASVILTFSIDPDEIFAGSKLMKLMGNDERLHELTKQGADYVAVLPFDEAFSSLSYLAFLDRVFGTNTPASMHIGKGFRFGHKAAGTVQSMREWGKRNGMAVNEHALLEESNEAISSTRIRACLSSGSFAEACHLLGRDYPIGGHPPILP